MPRKILFFFFFLLGEGEGVVQGAGGGGSFFYSKIPGWGGGFPRRGKGRGTGRVSAATNFWGGGGLNFFFRGRNVRQGKTQSQDTQPPLTPRRGLDYRGRVPDASP